MKIGVGGCSHSSTGYGYPWHKFMGQRYSAKIIKSSTSGGGNEANVEKIKYIFDENPDLDFCFTTYGTISLCFWNGRF
jgi:hypothetical protein